MPTTHSALKPAICATVGCRFNFAAAKTITHRPSSALMNAPRSTTRNETRKRVLTGSSSRKSILPVRTSSDRFVQLVRKNDADKTQLQSEPQDLDQNPQNEIALERHLARHGIFPERGVKGQMTFDVDGNGRTFTLRALIPQAF